MFHQGRMVGKHDMGNSAANPGGSGAGPVFLVLERDALIAEDIAGSLHAIGPCRTIRVATPAEISPHLGAGERISAAFLEMRLAEMEASGLHRRLAARGARIILTIGEDDAAQVRARGWGMLVRPFTDAMIREVLGRMGAGA